MKIETNLHHTQELRWIKDLNVSHDTIKILEENIVKFQISHVAIFFADISPRARVINEKLNNWDYIKLKSFCVLLINWDENPIPEVAKAVRH